VSRRGAKTLSCFTQRRKDAECFHTEAQRRKVGFTQRRKDAELFHAETQRRKGISRKGAETQRCFTQRRKDAELFHAEAQRNYL
ncbi:MAG: hypothetical protein R6V32_03810, partial [Bacteroidales bacterium]